MNLQNIKNMVETVLLNRTKHVGENEQTYTGTPVQLISEIAENICSLQQPTPPTEDRGWKERLFRLLPKLNYGRDTLLYDPEKAAMLELIREEIATAEARVKATLKERIEKELRPCLDYCREQNGRSDCKNCGLSEDTITRLLE